MPRLESSNSPNFAAYRTVGEAAEFLGVSTATLRNWDRSGKLKPRRHPQNGYRIYVHDDLEAVLRSADVSALEDDSFAPQVDWTEMGETEHFVQFYESDKYLIDSVSGYSQAALKDGKGSIIIATSEHRTAVERKLTDCGVDLIDLTIGGRFVALDAVDTLSTFMVDGKPDRPRFLDSVGKIVAKMSRAVGGIHAFGEMVALLWAEGNRAAAIQLEELWNELGKQHRFALFCAYPIAGFNDVEHGMPLDGICNCHTRVIPAESYAAIRTPDERLREITVLQQKSQSLEAEIAHRREVEKSLVQRERELADFFENATEGLHQVGPDGTILWANQAEYNLLGYSADEYIGRSIMEFHADADVIGDILTKLQRGETLKNIAARLRCKDGSIKHVLISSNVCFEDGKFLYTRCFTHDVTRQWHAEKMLEEANRRKDEFLATLAHELRNPLAPISNSLELLKFDDTKEVMEETRRIIERQVQQLNRLVDDLLDVSRITRDKIELRRENVELSAILKNAIEISRPLIDAAGHKLAISLPPEAICVNADPTRLAQVFSNLLNNSAKYTPPGGNIFVEVLPSGNQVIVSVKDDGIGIASDELATVFDMFRQVRDSRERAKGGLGIGLTLVRRLTELHGGSVIAQSEGQGKGSQFTVRLPRAVGAANSKKNTSRSSLNCPTRRILVVDDNKDSGDTLGKLFQAIGNEVQLARNGLQAIELAAGFRPDIIFMDIGMPEMDGYEATRRIRNTPDGKDIAIIALTGWGQPTDVQQAAEAGCSSHIVKPVDFVALERILTAPKS